MENRPLVSQDTAERHLMDALSIRVGREKRYSFRSLSEATGIPERTLRSYVDGTTAPLHAFLTLCRVLGPTFASDVLDAAGMTAKLCVPEDAEYMPTLAASCTFSAMLSDAFADGKVDHRERAQLQPVAASLIDMLEPLARITPATVSVGRAVR